MVDEQQNTESPSSSQGTGSASASTSAGARIQSASQFMLEDKISSLLWLTRLFTFVASLLFIFPFFGFDSAKLYQKALMANAATSALKLHQRIQGVPFQLNKEYIFKILIEDSAHYLLFSMIFMNTTPITIVLMPISAFALLHFATYTIKLFNVSSFIDETIKLEIF
jgi:transmembrane protein 33